MITNQTHNQKLFFKNLEQKRNNKISFAYELSEILEHSLDSIYRRIRGETPLNLDEILKLCNHFKVSFDSVFNIKNESVNFWYKPFCEDTKESDFLTFLSSKVAFLENIHRLKNKSITYVASNDIPFFHTIKYPELSAFRKYYWKATVLNQSNTTPIEFNSVNCEFTSITTKMAKLYNSFPSTEIWTQDTINNILDAIYLMYELQIFEYFKDVKLLCDQLTEIIHKITFPNNDALTVEKKIYLSDYCFHNNYFIIQSDSYKAVYIHLNMLNGMYTNNEEFLQETIANTQYIIEKSTLITGSSKIIRHQFFTNQTNKIKKLMDVIDRNDESFIFKSKKSKYMYN